MDINSSMTIVESSGCGCAACQSGVESPIFNPDGNTAVDVPSGAPTVYGTAQQMADQLISGYWTNSTPGTTTRNWTKTNISFSFGDNGYTNAEKQAFRDGFELWSDVTNLTFTEVGSGGDINILEGADGSAYSSSRYYLGSGNIVDNRISIDTDTASWSNLSGLGAYGFTTILHEIGHSLGLGHQGNYNGNVNYNDPNQVWYLNDNHQYSIMSYNAANLLGTDHFAANNQWQYAATPMLYDIMAIQQKYGANTSIRAGNTTYGFNSNAGRDVYDLTQHSGPFAIWDGGGIDTLDLSGYATNQTIRLGEGEFSDAGHMTNNIVIAYNAVIENAVGGSGDDSIYGNAANNILTGNNGNDVFFASTGSDTLNGGQGTDTANYTNYNLSDFVFNFINSTTVQLTHLVDNFTDTLQNIETFIFGGTSYNYATLQANAGELDGIFTRFNWTGGRYFFTNEELGSNTLSAADMGYSGQSGDMVAVTRTATNYTLNVLNNNAPGEIVMIGSDGNDLITINGTHNALGSRIWGGSGNDNITIGNSISGNDRLYGEAGDDIINAGDGNDVLRGGIGNDTLNGEGGNDFIRGEAGDDIINGGIGADSLYGDDGIDTIYGGNHDDKIFGDAGDDRLYGQAGADVMRGGEGHDLMSGGSEADLMHGENGDDTIYGDAGADYIYAGAGNDTVYGGTEDDWIYGGDGNDTIHGDAGRDRIFAGNNDDTIYGGADGDILHGQNGNDTIHGGAGNDLLQGLADNDTLNGDAGNDYIYGGDGVDRLNGGDGVDRMWGGNGNDTLVGGNGVDVLYGEGGQDVFGFISTDATDDIRDFSLSDDTLNITDILSGYTHGSSDINDFVVFGVVNTGRTNMWVDVDGAGAGGWTNVAVIKGADFTGLSASDLLADGTLVANSSLLV